MLIGEFEQMYQKAKNTPWHQNEQQDWLDVRLEMELLREYGPFDYIHDFGCGTGHFLDILANFRGTKDVTLVGMDVSETACNKARTQFTKNNFFTFDLMSKPDNSGRLFTSTDYVNALFSIRGTLWYVFPKMGHVVQNIARQMKINDLLMVAQNFPPLQNEFVGKEVLPNPEAIIKYFSPYFTIKKSVWIENFESSGNDNWFIGIFKKNARK